MVLTYLQLLAWLTSLPSILDGGGHPIARPTAAAQAIATVAAETENPTFFAAALDLFAARESGYHPQAAGDCPGIRAGDPTCTRELGAKSCGAWQTPCASTSRDPKEQARQWLAILRRSMAACPRYPLAVLGTGRCQAWGLGREAEIRAATLVPIPDDETVARLRLALAAPPMERTR